MTTPATRGALMRSGGIIIIKIHFERQAAAVAMAAPIPSAASAPKC